MEKKSLFDRLEILNEQLNIAHYWIIILKYKRLLTIIPVFIGLLGYLIALNINPIFQSNAILVIEKQYKNIVDIDEVYNADRFGTYSRFNYINNQIQIIISDEVIGGVLVKEEAKKKIKFLIANLPKSYVSRNVKVFKKFLNIESEDKKNTLSNIHLKSYIKQNLNVNNIRNSDVINLTFNSGNPELAKYALDEIVASYLRYDVDTKIAVTTYANKQINLRLTDLLDNMEQAEKALLNYKKQNNLIDIGDIKVLKTDQIKSVSQRIIDTNREVQKKENDLTAIKLAEGNVDELLAIADLRNKKEVDAIRTNISATDNNIEALQIIYKNEHPKLKKIFKTKQNLQNRLEEILDENIAAAAFELANLKNFIKASQEELDIAKTDLQNLEEKDSYLQKYVREVEMTTKIYETFLQRMKETNEVKELQSSSVKIIQTALLPTGPVSPDIPQITFVFYLISLFSLYGLLVYFEFNRNAVVEPSNLENLGIPILATLPSVKKLDKGYHLSQITSTYSGEGKTTIALNTSLAFSKIGKVLIIETDIRRPSVLTLLSKDEEKRPGFSDLIQGRAEFSDTIVSLAGTKIDLMSSGTRRSDLTDLITTSQLKEFFEYLKQSYDYIVLDTPPIQPVSDTLFISQATDHNFIIARANFTKLAGIKSAVKKLSNVSVKIDGLIFNDLDTSKASYYGYYQYGGYYRKYKSYS